MVKEFNEQEYNKMCAEFLGSIDKGWATFKYQVEYMHFDSDWNWIMEIVEKIEHKDFDIFINTCVCKIIDVGKNRFEDIQTFVDNNKKQAVILAIWEFLNWYKENK